MEVGAFTREDRRWVNRRLAECHMYVIQQGDRNNAEMMCTDGTTFFMSDQFVNPIDNTLVDMSMPSRSTNSFNVQI